MNLDEFVDSLSYDAFVRLTQACTNRMAHELSQLEYEEDEEEGEEVDTKPTTKSTYTTTPKTNLNPNTSLLGARPKKLPAPNLELNKSEKDLVRSGKRLVAIKSLKKRFKDYYTIIQCRDVINNFIQKENLGNKEKSKPIALGP